MIDITADQLAQLKHILSKYIPTYEIRVFGSRVTGKAKPYSDIDLAIVGQASINPRILRNLRENLQESTLPFRVDIVDWHTLTESFKKTIQKNGYETLSLKNEGEK